MISYNGKEYQDDEMIDWDIALDVDDSYFGLAKCLGLPSPPACFVFVDNHIKTDRQHIICGCYDALLNSFKLDSVLMRRMGKSL